VDMQRYLGTCDFNESLLAVAIPRYHHMDKVHGTWWLVLRW